MSHHKVTVGAALAAAFVGLTGGQALAQDATEVDIIVVTADKRETRLVDVPSTVNLIDGDALDAARIDNLDNLTAIVPGLEYGASGGSQQSYPSLRGVSPQVFGDPTVTIFQDGVALGNSIKGGSANFFDLDRVEVLKGPQSTLYGANSLGGAITMVSRAPDLDDFGGYARASFGEYGSRDYQAAVSLPIQEGVFGIRLAGQTTERDGYWNNVFDGTNVGAVENTGFRASALLEPNDSFRSYLVVSTSTTEDECGDCVNGITGFNVLNPNASVGTIDGDDLDEFVNQNVIGFFERDLTRITWENSLDFNGVTLTSLTGYSEMTNVSYQDYDRGPGNTPTFLGPGVALGFSEDFDIFSQEIRLQSNNDGPLRWLVGAYYSQSNTAVGSTFFIDFGFPDPTPIPFPVSPERFENFSLFTQNTWVISDRFELGFGVRYDRAEKESGGGVSTSSEEWLPRLSALYRLDDNRNLYATVSRGYKTGGINPFGFLPGTETYAPEFLWNYEVGYKTVSDDRRLRFEAAVYYTDWTDQQTQRALGIFTYIANAGDTEVLGAEALLSWSPTDRLDLTFAANYNDSETHNFIDGSSVPIFFGVNPDRSGSSSFLTPDWSLAASANYTHPLGNNLDLRLGGSVRYTGERTIDTSAIFSASAFTMVNASASVGNERVRFEVFADNLFDERYPTVALLFDGLQPFTYLGAPRVAGARIEVNF